MRVRRISKHLWSSRPKEHTTHTRNINAGGIINAAGRLSATIRESADTTLSKTTRLYFSQTQIKVNRPTVNVNIVMMMIRLVVLYNTTKHVNLVPYLLRLW